MNNTLQLSQNDVDRLLSLEDSELFSLIGVYSLPLSASPVETLELGRSDKLYREDTLGPEDQFENKTFRNFGISFFKKWAKQLQEAICSDKEKYKEVQKKWLKESDIAVATVVGIISSKIPLLSPYTGLLTLIGVVVVRTGMDAFCETFFEYLDNI